MVPAKEEILSKLVYDWAKENNMPKIILPIIMMIVLLIPSVSRAITWKSDPSHASVQFALSHLMVSTVRGTFDKFDVSAVINETNPSESSVEVVIEAASVNTHNEKRDEHLRGPDFFDVQKHSTITFMSKIVRPAGDAVFRVTGDLTIMGVTKEVVLEVSGSPKPIIDPWGGQRLGGSATTVINRTDYGLKYNSVLDSGGVTIGEEVKITIDIELVPLASS